MVGVQLVVHARVYVTFDAAGRASLADGRKAMDGLNAYETLVKSPINRGQRDSP